MRCCALWLTDEDSLMKSNWRRVTDTLTYWGERCTSSLKMSVMCEEEWCLCLSWSFMEKQYVVHWWCADRSDKVLYNCLSPLLSYPSPLPSSLPPSCSLSNKHPMEHCGSLTKTRPGRRLWSKWHSEQRRRRRRTKQKRQTRERKKKWIMNTVSQFPCQRKEKEKEQGQEEDKRVRGWRGRIQ